MGIRVELPVSRKKRALGLREKPSGSQCSEDQESWQWGAFEFQDADGETVEAHTTLRTPANALANSPDSSKTLIAPCTADSSSPSSSSPRSSYSTSSSTFSTVGRRRLKKKSESDSLTFRCNNGEDLRPSRWDAERWSPSSSFQERSGRQAGGGLCKCAAGLTADMAAICCCPFSLLHLLAIAFIKLPKALVSKTLARVKQKLKMKRKRSAVNEEDAESVPASSYPPSRSRSYEAEDIHTWAPELGFGDQRLWRDYFDSPDTGIWGSSELRGSKS